MAVPDPSRASTGEELAECLRLLRIQADSPSLRTLESRAKHGSGLLPGTRLQRAPLGRTAIGDVLAGRKFPGKAFLLTLVEACGVDLETDRRWEHAWDQLAPRQLAASRNEVGELRHKAADTEAENQKLRQELAGAKARIHELQREQTALRQLLMTVRERERQLSDSIGKEHRRNRQLELALHPMPPEPARGRPSPQENIARILQAGPVLEAQFPEAMNKLRQMPGRDAAGVLARLDPYIFQAVLGYLGQQPAEWHEEMISFVPVGPQRDVAADWWRHTRLRRSPAP